VTGRVTEGDDEDSLRAEERAPLAVFDSLAHTPGGVGPRYSR